MSINSREQRRVRRFRAASQSSRKRRFAIELLEDRQLLASLLYYSLGNEVRSIQTDGSNDSALFSGDLPIVSPDGNYVAFRRGTSATSYVNPLWVRNLQNGNEQLAAAGTNGYIVGYSFSADSQSLIYDADNQVRRFNLDSAITDLVVSPSDSGDQPAIRGSDGKMLLQLYNNGIYSYNPDGTGELKIPNTAAHDRFPQWSPDGQWISFIRQIGTTEVYEAYKIKLDGTGLTKLSNSTGAGGITIPFSPLKWNADGSRLFAPGTVGGVPGIYTLSTGSLQAPTLVSQLGSQPSNIGSLVDSANLTNATTLNLVSSDPSVSFPGSVTITAGVSAPTASVGNLGSVAFFISGQVGPVVPVVNGQAAWTLPDLVAADYSVVAKFYPSNIQFGYTEGKLAQSVSSTSIAPLSVPAIPRIAFEFADQVHIASGDMQQDVIVTSGNQPVISPDGKYMAFRRGPSANFWQRSLYIREIDTGIETLAQSVANQSIWGYSFTPDSRSIVYDFDNVVRQFDFDTAVTRDLVTPIESADNPTIRSDGLMLLAAYNQGIYSYNADGTGQLKIPNTQARDVFPQWSPDGQWISFLRESAPTYDAYKIRLDGTGLTKLSSTTGATGLRLPFGPLQWSADGNKLLATGTGATSGVHGIYELSTSGLAAPVLVKSTAMPLARVSGQDRLETRRYPTTTTLASSQPNSAYGSSVTFTATVSTETGSINDLGSVTFSINGIAGPTVNLTGNQASWAVSNILSGSHRIDARYNPPTGIGGHAYSTTSLQQTVQPSATAATGTRFVLSSLGRMHIVAADGSSDVDIGEGFQPVLSPNGKYLAFRRGTNPNNYFNAIFLRDLDTGIEVEVYPANTVWNLGYSFTSDSRSLVHDGGSNIIQRYDIDSNINVNLGSGFTEAPDVNSLDGRIVTYEYNNGLYLSNRDGTSRTKIPGTQLRDMMPQWSPDGQWIAFIRPTSTSGPEYYELHKIPATGGTPTKLSSYTGTDAITIEFSPPQWSEDGSAIYITGTKAGQSGIYRASAASLQAPVLVVPTASPILHLSTYAHAGLEIQPVSVAVAVPASSPLDSPVTITATVSAPNGNSNFAGNVTFSVDGVFSQTVPVTGTTATLTRSDFLAGDHTLTVSYSGASGYSYASQTTNFNIQSVPVTSVQPRVVFSQGDRMFLMSLDGLNIEPLGSGTGGTLSPDGKWLAFRRGTNPNPYFNDVWIKNFETGEERFIIAGTSGYVVGLTFSPDSRRLAYDHGGAFYIYDLLAFQNILYSANGNDDAPAFRRQDGRIVLYSSDGLYLFSTTMTGRTKIPSTFAGDYNPVWSPDGQWLAFQRLVSGDNYEFYKIRPDGTGLTKLSNLVGVDGIEVKFGPAQWSSDGTRLYVLGKKGGVDGIYWLAPTISAPTSPVVPTLVRATPGPLTFLTGIYNPAEVRTGTVTRLTASDTSSNYGSSITFTATVTPDSGSVSGNGSIEFSVDSKVVSSVPINAGGTASLTISTMLAGVRQVSAAYIPTTGFATSIGSLAHTVKPSASFTGPRLYIAHAGSIHAVSPDGTVDNFITQGTQPRISPDGRYLAFERSNGHLYLKDMESGVERVILASSDVLGYSWAADSQSIIYDNAGGIYLQTLDGVVSTISSVHGWDDAPNVNPVSGRITFHNTHSTDTANQGIWVANSNGTGRVRVTTSRFDGTPVWSPNGEWVAFLRWNTAYTSAEIYKVSVVGNTVSGLTQLSNSTSLLIEHPTDSSPMLAWSADDQTLMVSGIASGQPGIYSVPAVGSQIPSLMVATTGIAPSQIGSIATSADYAASTNLQLTASASRVAFGTSVTLTATMSSLAGTPSGTVEFLTNSGLVGAATLNASGVASLSVNLPPAVYGIRARLIANNSFTPSQDVISLMVDSPTTYTVGSKVVYSSQGRVYISNTDGSEAIHLTSGDQAKLSPNGTKVAFRRNASTTYVTKDIWVRDLATGNESLVFSATGDVLSYDWTTDSLSLVFDNLGMVRKVDLSTLATTTLFSGDGWNDAPSVNPVDGRIVMQNRNTSGVSVGLNIMSATGTGFTRVPNTTIEDRFPTWSPDGQWISFVRNSGGVRTVYKIRPDGTGLTALTSPTSITITGLTTYSLSYADTGDSQATWFDNNFVLAPARHQGSSVVLKIPADGSGVSGAGISVIQRTGNDTSYVGNVVTSSAAFPAAATNTWIGAAGGAWGTTANWSLGRLPGPLDAVVIPNVGATGADQTITFSVPYARVASITSSEKISIDGGVLEVTEALSSLGAVTLNGGTLSRAEVSASTQVVLNSTSGSLDAVTINGTVAMTAPGTITGGIRLAGSATIQATQDLYFNGGQTISGTGSIIVNGRVIRSADSSTVLNVGNGVTIRSSGGNFAIGTNIQQINNFGTIRAEAAGQAHSIGPGYLVNYGTVRVQSAAWMNIDSRWSNFGTITVDAGQFLSIVGRAWTGEYGNLTGAGTFDLYGPMGNLNRTFTLSSGTFRFRSGSEVIGGSIGTTGTGVLQSWGGSFSGVTIPSGNTLSLFDGGMEVRNGLTLNGTIINSSSNGSGVRFRGSQTVTGTGLAQLNSLGWFGPADVGTTLTIDSGLTIKGFVDNSVANTTIVNHGLFQNDTAASMNLRGGTFINSPQGRIVGSHASSTVRIVLGRFENYGTVTLNAGNLYVESTTWKNFGTITHTGGTLYWGGNFRTADIGNYLRTAGTAGAVGITGNMINYGTTLTLDNVANGQWGHWYLSGGAIRGGTITTLNAAKLESPGTSGTLDGVTISTGSEFQSISSNMTILNGLTVDGKVVVVGGNFNTGLIANGTQIFGGSGIIEFRSENSIRLAQSNMTLTLGSDLSLVVGTGFVLNSSGVVNTTLINNGTIRGSLAGTFSIQSNTFINGSTGNIDLSGAPTTGTTSTIEINSGLFSHQNAAQLVIPRGHLRINSTSWRQVAPQIGATSVSVTGGTLSVNSTSWPNGLAYRLEGGIFNLGGRFLTSTLGNFTRISSNPGTVNVTGTLVNTGQTLLLDPTNNGLGTFNIVGGTILGGTITTRNGALLLSPGTLGTLDGVTISTGSEFQSISSNMTILNGLTVDGKVVVVGGNFNTGLIANGTQTFGGSGIIEFRSENSIKLAQSNMTLTLGSALSLVVGTGYVLNSSGVVNTTLINNGSIRGSLAGFFYIQSNAFFNGPTGNIDLSAAPTTGTTSTIEIHSGVFSHQNTAPLVIPRGHLRINSTSWRQTIPQPAVTNVSITGGTLTVNSSSWPAGLAYRMEGGTFNVGGRLLTSALSNFTRISTTPGTINLTGTLVNKGQTLLLDPTNNGMGTLSIVGGTIQGGTITTQNGALLRQDGTSATLEGVRISVGSEFQSNSSYTYISNGLTVDGKIVLTGNATNNALYATGTQTWNGSGSIELRGSTNSIAYNQANMVLTIDSNLTVLVGNGFVTTNGGYTNTTLVNNGTLRSGLSGNFTIQGSNFINGPTGRIQLNHVTGTINIDSPSFVNQNPQTDPATRAFVLTAGTLRVQSVAFRSVGSVLIDGATLTLTPSSWPTGLPIHLQTGTLNIGGTLSTANLVQFTRQNGTGGTVNLIGTLNNGGQTLTLDTANHGVGTWNLVNGRINGGTITTRNGAVLSATSGTNYLTGIALSTSSKLDHNGGALYVAEGMTVDGTLDQNSNGTGNDILFNGTQTIAGSGLISMTVGRNLILNQNNMTLTFGPALRVRAVSGLITGNIGSTLINQGLIYSDSPNGLSSAISSNLINTSTGTIRMANSVSTLTLNAAVISNQGLIEVSAGTMRLGQQQWTNTGIINLSGGALELFGSFTQTDLGTFNRTGGSVTLLGTLRNQGDTLLLDSAVGGRGSWNVLGGTIVGGTVATQGTAVLNFSGNTSGLVGVTVSPGSKITTTGSPAIHAVSSLVGKWEANGNAQDETGGNHGTLMNGAIYAAGLFGNAFSLDGVDDMVNLGSSDSLRRSAGLTIDAYIFPTGPGNGASGAGGTIVNKEGEYQLVRYADGTIRWAIANSTPGWNNYVNTGYVAPLNTWTRITLTYDNGIITTYADGVEVHRYVGLGVISDAVGTSNDLRIGGRQAVAQHFAGLIDRVSLYSHAFLPNQLAGLTSQSLVNNGTIEITNANLRFEGATPLLDGTGTVRGISNNGVSWVHSNSTFTIGTNQTLSGALMLATSGALAGTTLVNRGTLLADSAMNSSLIIVASVTPAYTFINDVQGRIEAKGTSGNVSIDIPTWTNQGLVRASGGGTVNLRAGLFNNIVNSTTVGNYTSGTLSGGTWDIDGGTLRWQKNANSNQVFGISKLNANLSYGGNFFGGQGNFATYDALRDLNTVEAVGSLTLKNNRTFLPQGPFTNLGSVTVTPGSTLGKEYSSTAPTGLVSRYTAAGNANDSVGGNHGTLDNGVTFEAGRVGQGFKLNGTNQRVSIPDNATLRNPNMTVEGWVRFDALPSVNVIFAKAFGTGTANTYAVWYESSGIFYGISNGTTSVVGSTVFYPEAGVWHHLGMTFDDASNQAALYVDGVQRSTFSTNLSLVYDSWPHLLGADINNSTHGFHFNGMVDEVGYYNRALTATEISNRYYSSIDSRLTQAAGTFSNTGTVTGPTQISGGTLVNNSVVTTASPIAVTGGMIKGNGTFNAQVNQTGGVMAPGNSPGCTVFNGNYSLAVGGTLEIEIDGPTVCTQYDQVQVNGTVTLGGSINTILSNAYTPVIGTSFTVLSNDGTDSIVGTFSGLPERSLFADVNNQVFQVSYKGGDGNDVTLSYLGRGLLITSTLDSGPGSLRQAIVDSINLPTTNLIAFALPAFQQVPGVPDTYRIDLGGTPLPALNHGVRIDGRTQAEYVDKPVVEIRGNSTSNLVLGPSATFSSVVGLSLTGGNAGIEIQSDNSYVGGNYIGLTPTRAVFGNTTGIRLTSTASNAQIGGTTLSDRNVISGNSQHGVALINSNTNSIDGNYFGLAPSGQIMQANGLAAIYLDGASTNTIGTTSNGRNWIVGSNAVGSTGIELRNSSNTNEISFNTIGLTPSGSVLGNLRYGIVVDNSINNIIGDSALSPANVIANYSEAGISVTGAATLTDIRRNYVGLSADGLNRTVLSSNISARGVELIGVNGNSVGATNGLESFGNVISGNAIGILVDSQSMSNAIRSNTIGLNATGTAPIANVIGVLIDGASNNNTIGGAFSPEFTAPGLGNTISGNSTGIKIQGGSKQTQIAGNWVGTDGSGLSNPGIGNTTVGIHVASATETTVEDNTVVQSGTAATGSNNSGVWIESGDARLNRNLIQRNIGRSIQNNQSTGTIEVTQARTDGYVVGRIRNAHPNTTYSLEFFAYSQAIENVALSPLERGQSEIYLVPKPGIDPILVVTDTNGELDFELLPFASFDGRLVTATMTPLSAPVTTSSMAQGVVPTAAIIRGLPSRSPEGKPITLSAFGINNQIAGYSWEVFKGAIKIVGSSNAGVLFTPDDEGSYQVKLTLTLTSGALQLLGPHTIEVFNVAPVADFEYQPSAPRAGQTITFNNKSNDAGRLDTLSYQWQIRQGSPNGTIVFPPAGSSQGQAEQATFTPTGGGLYFAKLEVADGDGGTHSITRMIDVRGLPDQLSLLSSDSSGGEGRSIRVRVPESELRRAEEFNFDWKVVKTAVGSGTSSNDYPKTEPSQGTVEFTPDDNGTYVVNLTMTEIATGLSRTSSSSHTVDNTSPIVRIYEVNAGNTAVINNSSVSTGLVGQTVYFRNDIEDPGKGDTHTTNWTISRGGAIVASGTSSANDPAFQFTPTVGGIYTIQTESLDDDFIVSSGVGRGTGQRTFFVPTTEATVHIVLPTPGGGFVEGMSYNISSALSLPSGVTVQSYNWSSVARNGQVTGYGSTTSSLNFVPVRGGEHIVRLTVTLSDGQVLSGNSVAFEVTGSAPTFTLDPIQNHALALSPNPGTAIIREGDQVVIEATANDPNELVGITYSWELKRPGAAAFQPVRALPNNPSRINLIMGDQGTYEVRLTVTDSEGLSTVVSRSWTVANQTPSISVMPTALLGTNITFAANAVDSSPADQAQLTYAWRINGGTLSTPSTGNTLTTSLMGLSSIEVQVTDKDGAVNVQTVVASSVFDSNTVNWTMLGSNPQVIVVGSNNNDSIQIPVGTTVASGGRVILFGGDGNDTLDATNATFPVTLVAGSGANTLRGGSSENRFIGGGSDTMFGGAGSSAKNYFEVHFSDVVLNAGAGAITNTIDFSNSNTGSSGVTLNLSSTTGTSQNVVAGSTLALNGFFDRAIGTANNDSFTANTPGIIIQAGAGNDTIVVGGTGIEAEGGSGNDTFVLSDVGAAADAALSGGDGDDTFIGSLTGSPTESSPLLIDGGSGNNSFNIQGPNTGNKADVRIVSGEGTASITGTNLKGSISVGGWNPANSGVRAFGSVTGSSTMNVAMSNSSNIDIFGSSTRNASIVVTSSSDVDIFGVLSGSLQLGPSSGAAAGVVGARVHISQFGSTPSDLVSLAVTNSTDIDIFGSSSSNSRYAASVTNSSNIDIFGGMRDSGAVLNVVGSSNIDIFGADAGIIRANDPTIAANNTLANRISGLEVRLSEFGSTLGNNALAIQVNNSSDVDIFGSTSPSSPRIDAAILNSSDVDIFGGTARNASIAVTSSSDIGIFGIADGRIRLGAEQSNPPGSTPNSGAGRVQGAVIQAIADFGSTNPNAKLEVIVTNSEDVGIFGSTNNSARRMDASIVNSSDIGIFGSTASGGRLEVFNSTDIGLFANGSSNVRFSSVARGNVFVSSFGSTGLEKLQLNVESNSSDIGIFGSSTRNAAIVVSNSTDVDIFGGTAQTTSTVDGLLQGDSVTVVGSNRITMAAASFGTAPTNHRYLAAAISNSSDIDIFGSSANGMNLTVTNSSDVDIYGGSDDRVVLDSATRVRIEGGLFGSTTSGCNTRPLDATILGNSSDIGIFGTCAGDTVTVVQGTGIGINTRSGDDTVSFISSGAFAQDTLVLTDQGDDTANIAAGSNLLVYLASGNDRATISGGTNIRVLGGEGADAFLSTGGTDIGMDGGIDNDQLVTTGGTNVLQFGDAGDDSVTLFKSIPSFVNGGEGNDQIRSLGSSNTGNNVIGTSVTAILDGGAGNDAISLLPLWTTESRVANGSSNPLTGLPAWMILPSDIVDPPVDLIPQNVAALGGAGDDTIVLEGNQKLYGLGGAGNDTITLKSGSTSFLVGGDGSDTINHFSEGTSNLIFGDGGSEQDLNKESTSIAKNDTIRVTAGSQLRVYAGEGDDTVLVEGGHSSYVRGGLGEDTIRQFEGSNWTLASEVGYDTINVLGGTEAVADGGSDGDVLTLEGGQNHLLLGDSGNDWLRYMNGTLGILSGGDGNDLIEAFQRDADLYGDDGDDTYRVYPVAGSPEDTLLRVSEVLFTQNQTIESDSRGDDTLDLSMFTSVTAGAILDLRLTGVGVIQTVLVGQLQLELLGALESVIGTDRNDILTGTNKSNRLDGRSGDDVLIGLDGEDTFIGGPGNDTLDGGAGDDKYEFSTSIGSSLGSDTVVESLSGGTDWVDLSGMPAGISNWNIGQIDTTQSVIPGLLSLNIGHIEDISGTVFNDTLIGNGSDNRYDMGQGNDSISDPGGNDIYSYRGRNLGSDTISDLGTGRDTLDFTGFASPVNIDLAIATAQPQGAGTSLLIASGSVLENVVGTSFDDTILGNSANNYL